MFHLLGLPLHKNRALRKMLVQRLHSTKVVRASPSCRMRGSGRTSLDMASETHAGREMHQTRLPQVGQHGLPVPPTSPGACVSAKHLSHSRSLSIGGIGGQQGAFSAGPLTFEKHCSFTSVTTCHQDRERQRNRFGSDLGQWPRRFPGQSPGKATVFRTQVQMNSRSVVLKTGSHTESFSCSHFRKDNGSH